MVNGEVQNKDLVVSTGGYKLGKVVREHLIFPMAFTPASISSPSSTITVFIANDDAPQVEIDPITWL